MNKYVLDSSALLAFMNKELGAELVEKYLPNAVMSSVNIAEVVAVLSAGAIPDKVIESLINDLDIEIIDFDFNQALQVGLLRSNTKPQGLSLGDRACINLGINKKIPIITADKVWSTLKLYENIILIR